MESVKDFAEWLEQSDRELQEWLKALEPEDDRVLSWLV